MGNFPNVPFYLVFDKFVGGGRFDFVEEADVLTFYYAAKRVFNPMMCHLWILRILSVSIIYCCAYEQVYTSVKCGGIYDCL